VIFETSQNDVVDALDILALTDGAGNAIQQIEPFKLRA
jgi:hypothetical protein